MSDPQVRRDDLMESQLQGSQGQDTEWVKGGCEERRRGADLDTQECGRPSGAQAPLVTISRAGFFPCPQLEAAASIGNVVRYAWGPALPWSMPVPEASGCLWS